jgi:general secretion pathway protein A
MDLKKLQALYGAKWNPFSPELPLEALQTFPAFDRFCYRVEDQVMDGGFAACMGEPGLGKSVVLRMLSNRFSQMPNVIVGEFTRPQSSINDFYRELADLFRIPFSVSNRYSGHQSLRNKWRSHIETTLLRPVLLIDEAQALNEAVINEIKSLSSEHFDSKMLITVILAGDLRLAELLETPELKPIDSRLRYRLALLPRDTEDLEEVLKESLRRAGSPTMMTPELIRTLADKSMGNIRTLMKLANDCLVEGVRLEIPKLDEKLFLELSGTLSVRNRTAPRNSKKPY